MSRRESHPLQALADRLAGRVSLSEPDRAALLALPHVRRDMAAGEYLIHERDAPSHCCLMLSGFSYRHKIVANGGRQILAVHMAGDMVDLQNVFFGSSDHNVQTLTPCEVALIPRAALEELALSRSALGKALWMETLVDGSIFREWIANVGRRTSRERIAHFLCEFAVRLEAAGLGESCAYELPMTQEQLGDVVGLTAVHVNRTLMSLDREGLTERTRRSVIIRDWKGLARAGDFNTHYLHFPAKPSAAA